MKYPDMTCDQLTDIRIRLAMNRSQMADLCGVNLRTYHYWEAKKPSPNIGRFIKLLTCGGAVEAMRDLKEKEELEMLRWSQEEIKHRKMR